MAPDALTFYCPACGIKLTVPVSLAGINGPCPACRAQIQAPRLNAPPPAAIPTMPPYPSQAPHPALTPPELSPLADVELPASPPAVEEPLSTAPPPATPSTAKPEARPLPSQLAHAANRHAPTPDATQVGNMWNAPPVAQAQTPRATGRWLYWLIGLLFLIAALEFAYYILSQ